MLIHTLIYEYLYDFIIDMVLSTNIITMPAITSLVNFQCNARTNDIKHFN